MGGAVSRGAVGSHQSPLVARIGFVSAGSRITVVTTTCDAAGLALHSTRRRERASVQRDARP